MIWNKLVSACFSIPLLLKILFLLFGHISEGINSTYILSCEDLFDVKRDNSCKNIPYRAGDCCFLHDKVYCIPTVTIAGTQKGGTTELQEILLEHPSVRSKNLEIHFFDTNSYNGRCKVLKYITHFYGKINHINGNITNLADLSAITLDKTPSYMREEQTMQRMSQMIPDIKIILTLRHPTTRMFSSFRYLCARNNNYYKHIVSVTNDKYSNFINNVYYVTTPNFEFASYEPVSACSADEFHNFIDGNKDISIREGIPLNLSHATADSALHHISVYSLGQMSYGFYDYQISNILKYFPANQIMIVFQEQWMSDLPGTMNQIGQFLNLSAFEYPIPPHAKHGGRHSVLIRPDTELLLDKFYTNSILNLTEILACRFNMSLPSQWIERLHKSLPSIAC